ncbi:MAG: HAD-IB family phosphatase [Candidatus Hodarchaeota archaeon]
MSEIDTSKIISLSAIGTDKPGLIATITTKIAELNGNIIDVEENCRRGLFSIFLIVDFSKSKESIDEISGILKDLEGKTGLKIILATYNEEELSYLHEKENHVVTILGVDQLGVIAKVSRFFHAYNINIESCKMIARGTFFSMEMVIDTNKIVLKDGEDRATALDKMKDELKELCASINQSVVIQSENVFARAKKLVVFDVESTLIQETTIIDFLEKVEGKVKALDGACEFKIDKDNEMQALIDNAMLLKGIPMKDFETFSDCLELNPGTLELIRILKSMGFIIALLSSGFNFFIKKILENAGVDYAFSNTLKVDNNGIITGELEEPIITDSTKNELLEFIMNVKEINRDQVIAVGDGSTRSHFMKNVGLSIAFKPESRAKTESDGVLLSNDKIFNMLFCLGIPKTELEKYLGKNLGE